ncbi:MAG: hypothetical protein ACEQSH_00415 [Bacteroidia bacterium]
MAAAAPRRTLDRNGTGRAGASLARSTAQHGSPEPEIRARLHRDPDEGQQAGAWPAKPQEAPNSGKEADMTGPNRRDPLDPPRTRLGLALVILSWVVLIWIAVFLAKAWGF